jgi:hypothetical protein
VREGRFREDLFYRLNVITIELPPLRQRREDIPLLVDFFLKKYAEENDRPVRRITPGSAASVDVLLVAGQRARTGKRDRARRGAVFGHGDRSRSACPIICWAADRRSRLHDPPVDASLFEIVEDVERRIITDMLEKVQLEPDRGRRAFQGSALHAESENPASEYRNQENRRVNRRLVNCSTPNTELYGKKKIASANLWPRLSRAKRTLGAQIGAPPQKAGCFDRTKILR